MEYLQSWDELRRSVEKLLGVWCYAFDPDLVVIDTREGRMGKVTIPVWLAKRIVKMGSDGGSDGGSDE
jgi:hypothetical protein